MTENDYRNTIAFARKKAIAEGLAKGHAKGLAEGEARGEARGRIKMAKAMIGKGMELKTISEITGLSAREIAEL